MVNAKILAHWYVTTRCNSRCKTCAIWSDARHACPESSLESRVKLVHQLKVLGFMSIDFTGGEPLLYPGLPTLLRAAREAGIMTWLTTNGLLYQKQAEDLRGLVSALSFSLDSPRGTVHNAIRGVKCFDAAIAGIKLATSLGEQPMIKATVCKENVADLEAFAGLAAKLGALIEFNAEFAYFGNPPLDDTGIAAIKKVARHPNVIISRPHLQFMLDGGNDPRRPRCPIGKNVIAIAPDNGIYDPCMHLALNRVPLVNGDLAATLEAMRASGSFEKAGRYSFCSGCTIPCYMEPSYYATVDKYFLPCYAGRLEYLAKRARLAVKNSTTRCTGKGTP